MSAEHKTVIQLKKEAKEKGFHNYSKLNRAELCALLGYKNCGKRATKKTKSPKPMKTKKVSPKKVSPKKVSPKKVSPKKVSPKKVSPPKEKLSPKKSAYDLLYEERMKKLSRLVHKAYEVSPPKEKSSAKNYYTHDNGGRPFQVVVINKRVLIYSLDEKNSEWDHLIYHEEPFFDKEVERVLVGNSPLNEITKISGGYGKNFDGNSILLHLKGKEYIFVGESVFSFTSPTKISYFTSPVGNNDVPYPWAKNESEYFLFAEGKIIEANKVKLDDERVYKTLHEKMDQYDIYETFYIGKTPSKDMKIKVIHKRL